MSSRRKPQGRRRPNNATINKNRPFDMWRPVPPPPDAETITLVSDPTAIVRSLGAPPLQGQGANAGYDIARVVNWAAGLATALAATADLLATEDPEDDR